MTELGAIESMVRDILGNYGGVWPSDITDRVFVNIDDEVHRDRLELYWDTVRVLKGQGKNGKQIVNQYIGRLVKQLTTNVNRGRCSSPRSSLIKSYTIH